MTAPPALLLHFAKPNRNAFVALLGALEAAGLAEVFAIELIEDPARLVERCRAVSRRKAAAAAAFSFFTAQRPAAAALAKRCRAASRGRILLLAGGPHATGDPGDTLGMGFDLAVAGEGERAFPTLMRAFLDGGDPSAVSGVASRDGMDRVVVRKPFPPVDLDAFPAGAPAFRRFGPLEISRGCPHACAYCQTPRLAGRRMRHRSPAVLAAAAAAMRRLRMRDFRFVTPNAFAYGSPDGRTPDPAAVEGLLRTLREAAGPGARLRFGSFPSEVRPESVTPEVLAAVRRHADTRVLIIGTQSGSGRMLERSRRGHGPDEVVRAVELATRAGFAAAVDVIFGMPGETEADQRATATLMETCVRLGARIHAHTFTPLPGTPWAEEPPSPLSAPARRTVLELLGRGRLFGKWERQARDAEAFRPGGRRAWSPLV